MRNSPTLSGDRNRYRDQMRFDMILLAVHWVPLGAVVDPTEVPAAVARGFAFWVRPVLGHSHPL